MRANNFCCIPKVFSSIKFLSLCKMCLVFLGLKIFLLQNKLWVFFKVISFLFADCKIFLSYFIKIIFSCKSLFYFLICISKKYIYIDSQVHTFSFRNIYYQTGSTKEPALDYLKSFINFQNKKASLCFVEFYDQQFQ